MMKLKLLTLILALMIIMPMVSALDIDNIKDVSYDKLSQGYPEITIKNSLLWIIPLDPILDTKITQHTSKCIANDCSSTLEFNNYYDTSPIEDIRFIDEEGKEVKGIKYNFYKIETEKYTETIIESRDKSCIEDSKTNNGTMICSYTDNYKDIEKERTIEVLYDIKQTNLGKKNIKLKADITGYSFIDWQIKSNGVWIDELAPWTTVDCKGVGGDVYIDGDYCVHKITSNTTFNVSGLAINAQVLVVAGGGSGGVGQGNDGGTGAGAGGVIYNTSYGLSGSINAYIGLGAPRSSDTAIKIGRNGTNSTFGNLNALGGGYGAGGDGGASPNGGNGGSGGGAGAGGTYGTGLSGQGYNGGSAGGASTYGSGGGGGAGAVGVNGATNSGAGGAGRWFDINGTNITYGGGGGGGSTANGAGAGIGGIGGGGAGGADGVAGTDGTDGLGGGGGGNGKIGAYGGAGGDGVIIIRYLAGPDDYRVASVEQSYPVNNYNSSDSTQNLRCNFTGSPQNNISSVRLNVYDSSNNLYYTDTESGLNLVSYNKTNWITSALTDDKYNWSCYMFGDGGLNASTTNRTFTLDSTPPTISIITPTGNQGIKALPYNVTLNYTASDLSLQSCGWNSSFSATLNYTNACNTTTIISVPNGNTHRIYVYANDSFGNSHTNYTEFYPAATYSNATFNAITTEGTIENFKLYIVSSVIPTINSIVYNGSSYNGNIVSLGSNNYMMNNSVTIPLITSQQNVSFLWNITFSDSSTAVTPYYNQIINNFGVDNCTSNSVLLFNLSLYDEDSKAFLNGGAENTSVKIDLLFYNYGTTTLLLNYSNSIPYTNPVQICLASQINSSRYSLDGIVEYSSLGRFSEFYNIQRFTVDNSTYNTNIPLYDLNTSTGTEFKITYKDSNFIAVTDALVYIQRKYIEDGLFRTVEIPKTGADGTALGKFVRNNVIYNILFVKNGVTLATFSNIIPVCQNPTVYNCEINLNSLGSGTIPSDYSNVDGISFTMTYNKTTRTVSSTYAITSGVPETVSLNLTVNDALGTTIISSDSLLSAGGTLSANIPQTFGNGTVIAKLYKSNGVVGNALINIYQDPSDIYGGSWLFIALFAIIFIVGMAVSDNPMVYGASLVLGFAMLIMMNIVYSPSIIGVGATILYLVIGIIIIMMKGSERN